VDGGRIVDVLRRVESQPVQVILGDPVTHVAEDELTHGPRVAVVEVDGVAPVGDVLLAEVRLRVFGEIVPVRADVVVHDVQNHADTFVVRPIHESAKVVRRSIHMERSEQIDPVIAPAKSPGEFGDRHDLEDCDSESRELGDMFGGARPVAVQCECPDVHLVHHLAFGRNASPAGVGPREPRRIDDLRRPMRPLGLVSRRRIRK
jgi:hypothetical protein